MAEPLTRLSAQIGKKQLINSVAFQIIISNTMRISNIICKIKQTLAIFSKLILNIRANMMLFIFKIGKFLSVSSELLGFKDFVKNKYCSGAQIT